MNGFRMCAALRAAILPALLVLIHQPVAAQQQRGTLTGQVLEAETQQPIASAQVFVSGTALNTLTNAEGRYTLNNVPAGEQTVRVTVIGYSQGDTTVTVTAGGTTTADFALSLSAIELGAVIVTATGEE